MNQAEFLALVLGDREGFVEVLQRGESVKRVKYPLDSPLVGEDVYIVPAVAASKKEEVTYRAIGSNIDELSLGSLRLPPSVLIDTSPGRKQAVWNLQSEISEAVASDLRCKLVPEVVQTRFLRVPETTNTKYEKDFVVRVSSASYRTYSLAVINRFPEPNGEVPRTLKLTTKYNGIDPLEILAEHRRSIQPRLLTSYSRENSDFMRVLTDLMRSGLDDEEILYCAMHAPCNPFRNLKFGIEYETARYIELQRLIKIHEDEANQIDQILRREGRKREKWHDINELVIDAMDKRGNFVHTRDGSCFFVDAGSGEAVVLDERGSSLKQYVNRLTGINPVEQEHKVVTQEIIKHASERPMRGDLLALSHYDAERQRLSLHFGGKEVFVLTPNGIDRVVNGENDLVFRLPPGAEPVLSASLSLDNPPKDWWHEFIEPQPIVSGLTQQQASALLRVWTVFVLFRNAAASRPILSLLGPPGSGKSTLSRKLYRLFYGPGVELHTITNQANYDTVTSNFPFVLFDNTDAFKEWLAVAFAQSISNSEIIVRQLYTNNDPYTIRRQAIIALTSANPQFLQDDVIDRMLILNFRRFEDEERAAESNLLAKVSANRERLLSGLMADALKVVKQPPIDGTEGVHLRIQDFASMGLWIARALDIEDDFRNSVTGLRKSQVSLSIETDQVLVEALESYMTRRPVESAQWQTATAMWSAVSVYAKDGEAFSRRYKSAAVFGKKLTNGYVTLKQVLPLEFRESEKYGYKEWRLCPNPKSNE